MSIANHIFTIRADIVPKNLRISICIINLYKCIVEMFVDFTRIRAGIIHD